MAVELTLDQRTAVENRGGSLLVSAAAGSGKTKVLVDRLFRYVTEERCNIDDFLIITYTKAAAAELRSKIASELSKRLGQTPGDQQLRRQGLPSHGQGVIPGRRDDGGQAPEQGGRGIQPDRGGLAVHQPPGVGHHRAAGLANGLMAQADAEDGDPPGEAAHRGDADSGPRRAARAG